MTPVAVTRPSNPFDNESETTMNSMAAPSTILNAGPSASTLFETHSTERKQQLAFDGSTVGIEDYVVDAAYKGKHRPEHDPCWKRWFGAR